MPSQSPLRSSWWYSFEMKISAGEHIHLIGIGGSGLSAIARLLLQRGIAVSGSDRQASEATALLAREGAQIRIGHAANHVNGATLVVRSSAVSDENIEVQAALQRGLPVLKRADLLPRLLNEKTVVAVAGTHGKTTTTAMAAWVLTKLGQDPSFLIGGTAANLGTNAHSGEGRLFVIEADEYDRMFLALRPAIAVVTNIDYDHPDCFPTEADFVGAFQDFLAGLPGDGLLLAWGDEPRLRQLAAGRQAAGSRVRFYGFSEPNDLRAVDLEAVPRSGFKFDLLSGHDKPIHLSLQVPGRHNVLNAMAVMGICREAGLDLTQAAEALREYRGTARRFEVRGEADGTLVIDDYAHHPTEVRATLAAARERYPAKSIWAVWQPHTYSRLTALGSEFRSAFDQADHLIVTEVYAAREQAPAGFSTARFVRGMVHPSVVFLADLASVREFLMAKMPPETVLLVLSAGDANWIAQEVLAASAVKELVGKFPALLIDEPLARYSAARIGGPADALLLVENADDLVQAAEIIWRAGQTFTVLGGGSNVLILDGGVRGIVVINKSRGWKFEIGESPSVWAESGANLGLLSRLAAIRKLSGLEWAAGIPGSLGGAVVGNAGAQDGEIAGSLIWVDVVTPEGRFRWPADHLAYSYRSSRIKRTAQPVVVLGAGLRLQHGDSELIKDKMERFLDQRKATQPAGASMGSMFKNPPGDYAGRLIDAAGLKGLRVGAAEISSLHANFFINQGDARAEDVLVLIERARAAVAEKFGIELELEVELLGDRKAAAASK